MAASIDVNAKSLYLLNKYFIRPVLSLNTSVSNLNSSINNSAIALNASTLSNTSSITTLNTSLLANTSSIITLNASVLANTSSITILNASTLANTSSIINLDISFTNLNTSITIINSSITILNTSTLANISSILANTSSIATLNTSLINAIDTVNSTTLTIGGTNGTSSQSYGSALTSGTLNIATAITTGNINIGSATASNQVNIGGVLVGANAINASTNGTNFQIASTNTSGSISIGSSQTSGVLNIGTSSSRTAAINIGSTTGTGVISILTNSNANTYASPAINIGGVVSTKTIRIGSHNDNSEHFIGNLKIATNTANNNVCLINTAENGASNDLTICGLQTSGKLHLGGGAFSSVRNATGDINIGVQNGNTCPINIMNSGGATTGGSVNIANEALQTTTVNIASGTGTGTVTIGNSANTTNINSLTTNIRSLTTNIIGNTNIAINTQGTNPTYFEFGSGTGNQIIDFHCNSTHNVDYDSRIMISGGTSTAGNGDIGIISKSLAITCPLTLEYSPSLITGTNQLGYKINGTAVTTTLSGITNIFYVTLSPGVWIIVGNCLFNSPGAYYELSISTIVNQHNPTNANVGVGVPGLIAQVTAIISTASTPTYYLLASCPSASLVNHVRLNTYRIA